MKRLMLTAAALSLLVTAAHAGSKELPDCDVGHVERTLKRVSNAITIVETRNISSDDPTELRFCKSEILTSTGQLAEVIYELRWTSESEGRYWLQIKGGRML